MASDLNIVGNPAERLQLSFDPCASCGQEHGDSWHWAADTRTVHCCSRCHRPLTLAAVVQRRTMGFVYGEGWADLGAVVVRGYKTEVISGGGASLLSPGMIVTGGAEAWSPDE